MKTPDKENVAVEVVPNLNKNGDFAYQQYL